MPANDLQGSVGVLGAGESAEAPAPDPAMDHSRTLDGLADKADIADLIHAYCLHFDRAEAKAHPEYLELYETRDRDYSNVMRWLCRELAGGRGPKPALVADGLYAMIEGLWIDFLLHPDDFDRARSKQICLSYLAARFPEEFNPAADH